MCWIQYELWLVVQPFVGAASSGVLARGVSDQMQNLSGKTAFVTGGGSGIGLGIAKALLGAGMNVVIADIRDDHLEAAQAELGSPQQVLALKLDVTNRSDFARAADAAEARFAKIHLLCN